MRRFESFHHLLLRHLLGTGLDHDEAVLAAGNDEIQLALLTLLERRVDDILIVHQADAHAGDRLLERNLRDGERSRCAGDCQDVGVVFGIRGQHQRDDLRFVPPAGRKQRADRSIDDSARQDFLLGGFAFTFEESTGDAAGRVGVFAIVDRERQKIDAFPWVRCTTRRHQDDRVAVSNDHRAGGLLGQLAGFETQDLVDRC